MRFGSKLRLTSPQGYANAMRFINRLSLLGLAIALTGQALAWNETGHMAIAAIAEKRLTKTAKAEADRLLKIGSTEKAVDFITSGPWADDIRNERRETGTWHYMDLHFRDDGKPSTNKPDEENAVWAIKKYSKILADKTKPDAERADALRFIIHFVGDAHQPLHATARDTEEHPKGDRGGNDFKILPPAESVGKSRAPKNLHSLWDSGCGLFSGKPRPLTDESKKALLDLVTKIETDNPEKSLAHVHVRTPLKWVEESRDDAVKTVYALKENTVPSAEYMAAGKKLSETRAAYAGYRLADLLNRLLK